MNTHQTRRKFLAAAAVLTATPGLAKADPQISTLIGTGQAGMAADGEAAHTAKLNNPFGVLIGPDRSLYWADFAGHRVLKLDFQSQRVSVIAGNGEKGHSGDGGPAALAALNTPHEVRFDRAGNMFIAERDAHIVRHVDMKTRIISTVAGTGSRGFSGDGGPATLAMLNQPHSIALDSRDNLYICDILNNRVRLRDPTTGVISTFAGTGEVKDARRSGAGRHAIVGAAVNRYRSRWADVSSSSRGQQGLCHGSRGAHAEARGRNRQGRICRRRGERA